MNYSKPGHPQPEELVAFVSGKSADETAAVISEHLAGCETCRTVVDSLPPDTLMSLLREGIRDKPDSAEAATVAPSTSTDRSDIPTELAEHPRYRVLGLLGTGGMGAVYKAEHRRMERHVALKVMSTALTEKQGLVGRFHREVKAAARLTHPNIVTAYDADQAGNAHFLVMEFVEGQSLAQNVQQHGRPGIAEAADYIRQAALGLQHAFERAMVHRDIKPHNLMLTPAGQVKILDFGLARFVRESSTTFSGGSENRAKADGGLTEVGTLMGTADFIAPEQVNDPRRADIRADIYSLGCTLYFLLSGQVPFPGGTAMDKLMAHVEKTPIPLTKLRADVPAELARVVNKMMAKDPAQRYQTPAEAALALAPFTTQASTSVAFFRRSRRLLAAALLFLLGVAVAGIIYVQTDNGQFVIETKGEGVAVEINNKGGIKIHDRASGRKYELKAGKHTIRSGEYEIDARELPDGVDVSTRAFRLTRGATQVLEVTFRPKANAAKVAAETKVAAKAPPHNPFGVTDIEDPEPTGVEVQAFADKTKLKGGPDDANAEQWVTRPTKGAKNALDGEWYLRWRRPHIKEDWTYCKGKARIKTVGDRVYILYTDRTDTFLIETRRENGRLVGACQGTKVRDDSGPVVFIIAGLDRLDGEFGEADYRGRIDLRRKLPNVEPAEASGPDMLIKRFGPEDRPIGAEQVSLTPEQGGWKLENKSGIRAVRLYEMANPGVEDSIVKFYLQLKEGTPRTDSYLELLCRLPGKGEFFSRRPLANPNAMGLVRDNLWGEYELPFFLEKGQRPDLIKLNLVFHGPGTLWIKEVKVQRAPLPPGWPITTNPLAKVIRSFQPSDKTVTTDRVTPDGKGWRIDSREKEFRTVHLFEVPNPGVDGCLLMYRLEMKTQLAGTAYQEMWCRFPKTIDAAPAGEFFSKGLERIASGNTDWTTYMIPFRVEKYHRPDRVKLDLVVGGLGQVWIRNVELVQIPLAP